MSISERVLARYLERQADTEFLNQQFGRFEVKYLKAHAAAVEPTVKQLLAAEKMYAASGVPLKHNIVVALYGRGTGPRTLANYHIGSNPPLMQVAPKSFQDVNLLHTLVHELGHYYHDKVVPGRTGNQEIQSRYMWALRQKRTQEGGHRDVLDRKLRGLNKQYLELTKAVNIHKALPRKGQVFEFDTWMDGVQYHVKGRMVGKRDSRSVNVEVIDAPERWLFRQSVYRKGPGPLIVPIDNTTLTYVGKDSMAEAELAKVEAERTKVYEEFKGTEGQVDDRYQVQHHDWLPTTYARKDVFEYFAEMMTTLVLGHLKPAPKEWLLSVVETGEAPKT